MVKNSHRLGNDNDASLGKDNVGCCLLFNALRISDIRFLTSNTPNPNHPSRSHPCLTYSRSKNSNSLTQTLLSAGPTVAPHSQPHDSHLSITMQPPVLHGLTCIYGHAASLHPSSKSGPVVQARPKSAPTRTSG